MSFARSFLLAVTLVVGLIPVLGSLGSAGAAPNPNKPVEFPVDDTFPAPNSTRRCGFAVTAHVVGTFTVKLLPRGVELVRVRYDHIFTGPGGSISVNHVENLKVSTTLSPDGTKIETVTATGTLLYHTVVPGHGSIANNSGREVFQITYQYDVALGEYVEVDFQVFFDSGPNDELSDADWAVFCEQLA